MKTPIQSKRLMQRALQAMMHGDLEDAADYFSLAQAGLPRKSKADSHSKSSSPRGNTLLPLTRG